VTDRPDRLAPVALIAITTVYVALFGYYLQATSIRLPFWDMFAFVQRYLRFREDGALWAYLWAPHVQHRLVWIRLLTAFDVEALRGTGYPFIVFATLCQLLAAGLLCGELRRGPAPPEIRRAVACLVLLLVLTSVSAVDCSIPIVGIYPQALAFALLGLVLFDGAGEGTRLASRWRRIAALAAAAAAGFGNAVGLVIWPILLWSAWRGRAGFGWAAAIAVIGGVYIAFYVHGLPVRRYAFDGSHPLKVLDYLLTYLGLPWTRSAALAVPGRALGALLLVAGLVAIVQRGLLAVPGGRLERIAVGLILFSLASATLAALGRVDADPQVKVPVRYAVLVAPLHVGLLWLALPWLARQWRLPRRRALIEGGMLAAALLLLAQQVAAGEAAAAKTRSMTAAINRFLTGQRDPEMTSVVYRDLDVAQAAVNAMRRAGVYLDRH
jgi:hypothetical protein